VACCGVTAFGMAELLEPLCMSPAGPREPRCQASERIRFALCADTYPFDFGFAGEGSKHSCWLDSDQPNCISLKSRQTILGSALPRNADFPSHSPFLPGYFSMLTLGIEKVFNVEVSPYRQRRHPSVGHVYLPWSYWGWLVAGIIQTWLTWYVCFSWCLVRALTDNSSFWDWINLAWGWATRQLYDASTLDTPYLAKFSPCTKLKRSQIQDAEQHTIKRETLATPSQNLLATDYFIMTLTLSKKALVGILLGIVVLIILTIGMILAVIKQRRKSVGRGAKLDDKEAQAHEKQSSGATDCESSDMDNDGGYDG